MSAATPDRVADRRRNLRFELRFRVFLRALGEPWTATESSDISASGVLLLTDRPFLLNTPVEYVISFPQELTKSAVPLRIRFHASILRCERVPGGNGTFRVALRNTAHRYLTTEEGAVFDAMEQKIRASSENSRPPIKVGL